VTYASLYETEQVPHRSVVLNLSYLEWACFRLHLPASKKPRWGVQKGMESYSASVSKLKITGFVGGIPSIALATFE
jgi:hypothetical protein